MSELDVLKVRCFDAENRVVEMDKQMASAHQTLTDVAGKLGIMFVHEGKNVFRLEDINPAIDKLLDDAKVIEHEGEL